MPTTVEPMKAMLADPPQGEDWNLEVKWDGYRAIAFCDDRFRLQGRRLNDITSDFPEVGPIGFRDKHRRCILDGELVVLDAQGKPDFQLMQSRKKKQLEATYLVFDLLWLDDLDLRANSYAERREQLESIELEGSGWSLPERLDASLEQALAATAELGLEGVVAKDPASPYVEGSRSNYWIKVKHGHRQEFVVGGSTTGKGHRSDTLGALLLGYHEKGERDLRYAGRVGTGMGDELLTMIAGKLASLETDQSPFASEADHLIPKDVRWMRPELVVEVRFSNWTADGQLRHPVLIGLRPDKDPADVLKEEQ